MTALYTTLAVCLLLVSIGLHEAGHAIAMREYGIRVARAGLGFPIRPMIKLRPTVRRPFTLTLSPWLLGAYVEPHDEDTDRLDQLPYRKAAWIFGAGITINWVLGAGLLAASAMLHGRYILASASVAVALLIWLCRRQFAAYVLPGLSFAALAIALYGLATTPSTTPQGVVGWAEMLTVHSMSGLIGVIGVANIGLAVLNSLPFFPFDGGQIWVKILTNAAGRRAATVFQAVGAAVTFMFLGYALLTDVLFLASR